MDANSTSLVVPGLFQAEKLNKENNIKKTLIHVSMYIVNDHRKLAKAIS